MTGLYLLSIKEYASAKTEAVTPEPHENTTFDTKFMPVGPCVRKLWPK